MSETGGMLHRWRALLSMLAGYLLLAALAFYLWTVHIRATQTYNVDFVILYISASHLLAGEDVYQPAARNALGPVPADVAKPGGDMHPNLNPPFWVLLSAPLALLPYPLAFWLWSLLSLLAGGLAVWLLWRAWPAEARPPGLMLTLLLVLLVYFPTWISVSLGQNALALLLLLTAAWRAAASGRERGAGLLLGLALALKPFTGMLLILAVLLGRWRLLLWLLAGFAAANLAAALVLGPGAFVRYAQVLDGITWHAGSWNASVFGFFTRLFGGSENAPPFDLPGLGQVLPYLAAALAIAALVWLARTPAAGPPERRLDLGFAYSLVLMLLLSPLGWMYYFPVLLMVLLVVFRETRQAVDRRGYRLAAVFGWLLAGVPHMMIQASDLRRPIDILFYPSLYPLALVILGATLLTLARRRQPGATAG